MDIDCGEDKAAAGKGYATTENARKALIEFSDITGLPKATHIVHSGGGLHAYWAVYDLVTRDTWQSYAKKLKAVAKACGFLVDPSRTADIASVLRVPGTLNHKFSPPRTVSMEYASDELIEWQDLSDAIDHAHDRLCDVVSTKKNSRSSSAATSKTTGNADVYGPPELDKLASALTRLDPDCDEETWKLRRIAPLADAARNYPDYAGDLYELAWSWSSGELSGTASTAWKTPGGNGLTGEEVFDDVWLRFLEGRYIGAPVTLGTIYYDARQVGCDPEDQFKIINVAAEGDA